MNLTARQGEAVAAPGSVAVTAGAGTGKTFLLVERYLYHLEAEGLTPLQVVTTTFTRKAAAELRSRIRARIQDRFKERPDLLAEVEAAPVTTLDSLSGRICRDHPQEAGVPADFSVLDEETQKVWLARSFDTALDAVDPAIVKSVPFPMLRSAMEVFLKDPIAAQQALSVDPEVWEAYRLESRAQAKQRFLEKVAQHKETLRAYEGPEDDPLEGMRRNTLRMLTLIDEGERTVLALQGCTEVDLRRGSKKAWGECIGLVKGALSIIKDAAGRELKRGEMTLDYTDTDAQLQRMLPLLQEAFGAVRESLAKLKRQERVLTFADVQVHALKALEHEHVRAHYEERWQAFLVDEVQDLNPVQEDLIKRLTRKAKLTLVGDAKQSIYAFRRADPEVFTRLQKEVTEERGGKHVVLDESFRTHKPLVTAVNRLTCFLGDLHQPLSARREDAPSDGPHVEAYVLNCEASLKDSRRRAEGRMIARRIRELMGEGTLVHDKKTSGTRRVQYGDITVLTRYKKYLPHFLEALESEGVPAVLTDSDDLLEAREAKDGLAFLRFLADPSDTHALVALLRSPFFALGDTVLQAFAVSLEGNEAWWQRLHAAAPKALVRARDVLKELLQVRRDALPSELLQKMDEKTGYSAVIANLPGARRREADWRGFQALVRQLEADQHDTFAVCRAIKRLKKAGASLPRPTIEVGNAVTLMNVHKAKGLEWPVVILASLEDGYIESSGDVMMHPEAGVGLKLKDQNAGLVDPIAYTVVKAARNAVERLEDRRVLYVALTRARDRLILTASEPPQETRPCDFNLLKVDWGVVRAQEADALPADLAVPERHEPDVVLI